MVSEGGSLDTELEERVSSDPEIVVSEPFGSVDIEGAMLVTEKF